jgi:putative ATP-dependent endonuclease of OLD family
MNIDLAIEAKNLKCIGQEPQGFTKISPINLIIGKNNSGKSALLDLIENILHPDTLILQGHQNKTPEIYLTQPLSISEISQVFSKDTSGGGVPGSSFYEYGIAWLGAKLTVKKTDSRYEFIKLEPPLSNTGRLNDFYSGLASSFKFSIHGRKFKKIAAERDIIPEKNRPDVSISPNGIGASDIIQTMVNKASLGKRDLVEIKLLAALNEIFYPESVFIRILPQLLDNGTWEIFLEEEYKGRISLSNSGSGLKTIILVLIHILLIPALERTSLSNYIFAFEELENNLHPSLQRKLLLYLRKQAEKEGCIFFLTTHSNIVIDLFSNDDLAQIIHVKNDGRTASVKTVSTYLDNHGILDDLDFRASDLLQSNGVIWVEGPSDRVYFNRWIDLWTDGKIKEGVHYQCLFYGGKLLAHLTASDEEFAEGVSILKVNRNCIMLMDSDKKSAGGKINKTKTRIESEITAIGGMTWITDGIEVENYIPVEALEEYYEKKNLAAFSQFKKFSEYLNENIKKGEGDCFSQSKVLFANRIAPTLKKELLINNPKFKDKISEAFNRIKEWNKL